MSASRHTSEVRRAELVDAALRIIETRGIAMLSTRSLAAEVGLSSGAMFRHFQSLDCLLDAVIERVERVLEETFPSPELPPLERVVVFVRNRSTAVGGQPGMLKLVLSEQFRLALPGNGSARLMACVHRTREFLVSSLREAQLEGSVRADLPADALTLVVMGAIQASTLGGHILTPQELARDLPDVVPKTLMLLLQAGGGNSLH